MLVLGVLQLASPACSLPVAAGMEVVGSRLLSLLSFWTLLQFRAGAAGVAGTQAAADDANLLDSSDGQVGAGTRCRRWLAELRLGAQPDGAGHCQGLE